MKSTETVRIITIHSTHRRDMTSDFWRAKRRGLVASHGDIVMWCGEPLRAVTIHWRNYRRIFEINSTTEDGIFAILSPVEMGINNENASDRASWRNNPMQAELHTIEIPVRLGFPVLGFRSQTGTIYTCLFHGAEGVVLKVVQKYCGYSHRVPFFDSEIRLWNINL